MTAKNINSNDCNDCNDNININNTSRSRHHYFSHLPIYISILHIAIRIFLANIAPITDCDEVYNYWEPLHYIVNVSNSSSSSSSNSNVISNLGLQTWEYAPQYALRTYAYLLPLSFVSRFYNWLFAKSGLCSIEFLIQLSNFISPSLDLDLDLDLVSSLSMEMKSSMEMSMSLSSPEHCKVLIFHLLRVSIAIITSIAELNLINSIAKFYAKKLSNNANNANNATTHTTSNSSSTSNSNSTCSHVAFYTWIVLLTSTGMFHTAPAFLPSSTVMICIFFSLAEQIQSFTCSCGAGTSIGTDIGTDIGTGTSTRKKKLDNAIIYGLIAILMTGWPFCAVCFIPLGVYTIFKTYNDTAATTSSTSTSSTDTANVNTTTGTSTTVSTRIIQVMHLLKRVILYTISIQTLVMIVDHKYYGKIISPTINIFIYNTGLFSNSSTGSGSDLNGASASRDELYGVEDVSYYIKNLILNWNIAFIMSIVALPFLILVQLFKKNNNNNSNNSNVKQNQINANSKETNNNENDRNNDDDNDNDSNEIQMATLVILPMILWICIVFSRPHKEERFLFPIYPSIAIGTALLLDKLLDVLCIPILIFNLLNGKGFSTVTGSQSGNDTGTGHTITRIKMICGLCILAPFILFSISRSVALADGYTAPLKVYTHLHHYLVHHEGHTFMNDQQESKNSQSSGRKPTLVCTGGEWYRFPSSYHLPGNVQLAFLKSSFGGQLPQQFTTYGSREESLLVQSGHFNDLNQEENDRYVDISECSYVIELLESKVTDVDANADTNRGGNTSEEEAVNSSSSECSKYMKKDKRKWVEIGRYKFLDAEKTPLLHRVLYLPYKRKAAYQSYSLFKAKGVN